MSAELIVIGGSWGGFDALCQLLASFRRDTPLPIVAALHRSSRTQDGALEQMLAARLQLEIVIVEDKTPLRAGCVHVAPADYHLLIEDGSLALSTDALVQYSRPSIDVLFDSAAYEYGSGVVAVLLSGANSDGAAGLQRIKNAGGSTLVQDPATATRPEMPQAAIDTGAADFVGPIPALAGRLAQLMGAEVAR